MPTPKETSLPRRAARAGFTDGDRARRARRALAGEGAVRRMARTFRVLGDPTRAKVVLALSVEELCVTDLARLLGTTPSVISHQLRVLRDLDLVRPRRQGKSTYYRLDDAHVRVLFREGMRRARSASANGR
ncbi:MAG TPA: metalloregulator ArsR/SmtB family transcription factor [Candidatus Eisenbacteria bacterium]|nr:metalloregulator ArsR/SmtB family transcription factor [Candidatus Eisenbacteria bacterium]